METQQKPSILTGALVGLMLTAPLIAIFFLGDRLIGLPLVPLDFFDWLVPVLPGEVITFGIDAMVDTLIALGYNNDVDTIAKTLEQAMGFTFVLVSGIVAATVLFALLRSLGRSYAYTLSLFMGLLFGVFFGYISFAAGVALTSPAVTVAWVVVLYAVWGLAHGWIYRDLMALPAAGAPAKNIDSEIEARVEQVSRREFIVRVGGATATVTVVGTGLGLVLGGQGEPATDLATGGPIEGPTDLAQLPNANAAVQPAPGTRPEYTPVADHYRIDISTRPIEIDLAGWVLPFTGLVAEDRNFTMDELRAYPATDQFVTLQCISNRIGGRLISTTRWTGVPVRDVLADLEINERATHLLIGGGDGFDEYVSLDLIASDERIMFTYDWDGQPLPSRNGFPLRIYIPDRYGMKQPKWIDRIEVVAEEGEPRGYWVRRGWSQEAIMKTSSVIDTVATDAIYEEDGQFYVPVGGISIAGARSISRVEVRINGGEWTDAQLRDPLSDTTWVIWRYDWAFPADTEGAQTFEVRCYDGNGDLQPTETVDPRPDGASGIHSATAAVSVPTETEA